MPKGNKDLPNLWRGAEGSHHLCHGLSRWMPTIDSLNGGFVVRYLSRHHAVEQRLEIIHMLVDHAVTMQLFKKLLRTRYFCLLHRTKLE